MTKGLCECGCGKPTRLAERTDRRAGIVKGQPQRFLCGHAGNKAYTTKSKGQKHPWMAGKNNPAWVGGSRTYWCKQAFLRDDYTCRNCDYREPEIMEADHIIPVEVRPDLKCNLENIQTLCPNCHRRKTIREHKARVPWNKGLIDWIEVLAAKKSIFAGK